MAGPVRHLDELECTREDLKTVLLSGIKTMENPINQTLYAIVSLWKLHPFIEHHQQKNPGAFKDCLLHLF